jgi:hypothetical protein
MVKWPSRETVATYGEPDVRYSRRGKIEFGFLTAGARPFNTDEFAGEDFSPSAVTDLSLGDS